MSRSRRRFADRLLAQPGEPVDGLRLRQGVITAVAAGPPPTVTVKVGKATTNAAGIRYVASYAPAVNDIVFLLQNGPDLLCMGPLASAAATFLTPAAAAAAYIAKGDVQTAAVSTSEGTTSTSLTDLTTVGPAVSVTIGSSGKAIVVIGAEQSNSIANGWAIMGYAISGATTVAAAFNDGVWAIVSSTAAAEFSGSRLTVVSGLTPGVNTFAAKYRAAAGGTATFALRRITVIPL